MSILETIILGSVLKDVCPICKGTGIIEASTCACEYCGWDEHVCDECGGTGKVNPENIEEP